MDLLKEHMSDFWANISLPGFKYVGETGKRRQSDRCIWMFVLFISMCVSSKYIGDAYRKWQSSPVLLSFNDSLTPISLIPFPAVTLCPPRRISNETSLRQTQESCEGQENCTQNENHLLSASRLLCPKSNSLKDKLKKNEDCYDSVVVDHIEEVAVLCEEVLRWFKFATEEYSAVFKNHSLCHQYFQTLYSDGGNVCFSYNMLPAKDMFRDLVIPPLLDQTIVPAKPNWSPDSMLKSADMESTIPRYIDSNGRWFGLYVGMENYTANTSGICGKTIPNIKVFVHNPAEIPMERTTESFELLSHKHQFAFLHPKLVIASEELNAYTPSKRRCYYSHERPLSLFKIYTQTNCQLECRANCSLRVCDCVPFYLPRMNDSVKVCGKEFEKSCSPFLVTGILEGRFSWATLLRYFSNHTSERLQKIYEGYETRYRNGTKMTKEILDANAPNCSCECPAACNSLQYEVVLEEEDPFTKTLALELTKLAVSFHDLEFTSVMRKELIGVSDFIANSGGVLGVFTGFSFVALCELVSFLTIRLWSTIKHSWEDEVDLETHSLPVRRKSEKDDAKRCLCCGHCLKLI